MQVRTTAKRERGRRVGAAHRIRRKTLGRGRFFPTRIHRFLAVSGLA
jgi:hypothetical protein